MEHIQIYTPIRIAIADLPGDIQARVIGTHILATYTWYVAQWTNNRGFEGNGTVERRYRQEHERVNNIRVYN